MNKLEKNIITPDDSDIVNFVEINLKYPDKRKGKQKTSHLLWKIKNM